MLVLFSMISLYVLQLVLMVKRWVNVTVEMLADMRQRRMRRAIDWSGSRSR